MRELTADERKQWIINRQGKDMILSAGLLHLAHEVGMTELNTDIVSFPSKENNFTTYVKASVTLREDDGTFRTFCGHGDANADNVGRMVALHCPRMAETRAINRALRFALDVGYVSFDEVGEDDEGTQRAAHTGSARPAAPAHPAAAVDPDGLASAEQADKLAKLHAALGMPQVNCRALSAAEAAKQIAECVRLFNAQARKPAAAAAAPDQPAAQAQSQDAPDPKGPASEYTLARIRKNLEVLGRGAEFAKLPSMTEMKASTYLAMLQGERAKSAQAQ